MAEQSIRSLFMARDSDGNVYEVVYTHVLGRIEPRERDEEITYFENGKIVPNWYGRLGPQGRRRWRYLLDE